MKLIFYALLPLLLGSCSKPLDLPENELNSFILNESNGLYKKKHVEKIIVEVVYRPTDLLVHQELNDRTDTTAVCRLRGKYAGHYYFILRISSNQKEVLDPSDAENFSTLLQTLSFRMQEHVSLTTMKDTVKASDVGFERTYGMAASTNIMFAFETEKLKKAEWFNFNLKDPGIGIGNINFRFDTKSLQAVPRLQF